MPYFIEIVAKTVNGNDSGEIFNFHLRNGFGSQIFISEDRIFFYALGDKGSCSADSDKIRNFRLFHCFDNGLAAITFSYHSADFALLDKGGGVGVHSAGSCRACRTRMPPGRQIGDALSALLDRVLEDPGLNQKEILLKLSKEL